MQHKLIKKIHIIARCSTLYRDAKLSGSGLNGFQAAYLPIISQNPGLSQEELAGALHVNRSSVTRQLVLLEENGFVTRERSETDRRSIQVFPTQKLSDTLPLLYQIFGDFRAAVTKSLSLQEQDTLAELLGKVSADAEMLIREDCSL